MSLEALKNKLDLVGIDVSIDTINNKETVCIASGYTNEVASFVKDLARLEGYELEIFDAIGETASYNAIANSIDDIINIETSSDEEYDEEDDEALENDDEEDEDEVVVKPKRSGDASESYDESRLNYLIDRSAHKMASNLYAALGNDDLSRYPMFLKELDKLLMKYKNVSVSEEASFSEEFIEEIAGKKEKSPRQLFLSELMKTISGDDGENVIRQWREGRFEKFTGSMIKIAKMMIEHSPSYKETASDDIDIAINKAKMDMYNTEEAEITNFYLYFDKGMKMPIMKVKETKIGTHPYWIKYVNNKPVKCNLPEDETKVWDYSTAKMVDKPE